jgi:hypothetical protein
MARYTRNAAILAKIESVYGTDPTPSGAANAILVSNLTINPLNANNISRDLIRSYFGGSEQLVGTANVECSFDVELQSSGALGTAPAWGPLLRACAFAETITASTRVEYAPVTNSVESVTIYYHDDGVLHKLLGARGTVEIKMNISERPMLMFKFTGLDGGISAVANPSTTLTGWKTPAPVTDTNTGDVTLGCTYTTGTLSAGTAYPSRGIEFNIGNDVKFTALLGGETVDLTQRDVAGKFMLDLTAANEVSFMATVKANTTQAVGITHGTGAGYVMVVHAPAVQIFNPRKEDVDGRRLIGYDFRAVPVSGNDEIKICCR